MNELKILISAHKNTYCELENNFRLIHELKTWDGSIIAKKCDTNRFVFDRRNSNLDLRLMIGDLPQSVIGNFQSLIINLQLFRGQPNEVANGSILRSSGDRDWEYATEEKSR